MIHGSSVFISMSTENSIVSPESISNPYLIGITFDSEEKNITDFAWERVGD